MQNIQEATLKIQNKNDLSRLEMNFVFEQIFQTESSDSDIRQFLIALYQKGESLDEILGACDFLLKYGHTFESEHKKVWDCCGTGGTKKNTFNFSTAVSLILSACDLPVAKHGNKAVSSNSGSADIFMELGLNIQVTHDQALQTLNEKGISFFFAPNYYGLLKRVGAIRKSIAHRTIFNLLGPLLNPVRAKHQLLGVYDKKYIPILAKALRKLGTKKSIVVSSDDGLDEFSLTAINHYALVTPEKIEYKTFDPREIGYDFCKLQDIQGVNPKENALRLKQVLKGHSQPLDHMVHMNAAWALMLSDDYPNYLDALLKVQEVISSGKVYKKLEDLILYHQKF